MDTDINDLYNTDASNLTTSISQDVLQVSDDDIPVLSYFSQKTIDNKMNTTKLFSSQQLLTFIPEMTISNQILIPAQKTKLHMLVAEWIVSDTLSFSIISSESFATILQYLNANIDLPSCETIKSTIQSAFVIMQKDIKILLNQASSKISITLDIWTSCAN
ncbi:21967_t:CDS:2, partial [Gigaspora margarita]